MEIKGQGGLSRAAYCITIMLLSQPNKEVKWEVLHKNPKFIKSKAQVNQTDQKLRSNEHLIHKNQRTKRFDVRQHQLGYNYVAELALHFKRQTQLLSNQKMHLAGGTSVSTRIHQ